MNSSEPLVETLPVHTDAVSAPDAATLEEQTGHQLILSLRANVPAGVEATRETVLKLLEGFAWEQKLLHVHGADQNHKLIADFTAPTFHDWQQLEAHVRRRAEDLKLENVLTSFQS